jgi:hypothetical protein
MSDWFEETYNNDNLKLLRGKLDKAKAECDKAEAEMPEDLDRWTWPAHSFPLHFFDLAKLSDTELAKLEEENKIRETVWTARGEYRAAYSSWADVEAVLSRAQGAELRKAFDEWDKIDTQIMRHRQPTVYGSTTKEEDEMAHWEVLKAKRDEARADLCKAFAKCVFADWDSKDTRAELEALRAERDEARAERDALRAALDEARAERAIV